MTVDVELVPWTEDPDFPANSYQRKLALGMDEIPEPDEERMLEVLDFIREHRKQHHQGSWHYRGESSSCGTTQCFAGWTATLAGAEWVYTAGARVVDIELADRLTRVIYVSDLDDLFSVFAAWDDDKNMVKTVHVRDRAKRLLRINDAQAQALFVTAQTFDQLEHAVKALCNGTTARQLIRELLKMEAEEGTCRCNECAITDEAS